MSNYYLFDLPPKLVDVLEPFKLSFKSDEPDQDLDASSESDSGSSESESESENESASENESDQKNKEDQIIRPSNLSYTQYNDSEDEESMEQWQWANRAHITGSPFVYYANARPDDSEVSHFLSDQKVLAIYKSWFSQEGLIRAPVDQLKQLPKDGKSCILMVNSGNFAGAIIQHKRLSHKTNISNPSANIVVLESKTFHRYTTRRKQGGSQSASDAARGKANSAGSTIRRANERALQEEIKELLQSWEGHLQDCHRIFFKAPGRSNKQLISGYKNAPIRSDDERLVQVPFASGRPTLAECKQAWLQLTRAVVVSPPTAPEPYKKREASSKSQSQQETVQSRKSKSPEAPSPKTKDQIISDKIVELIKRSKLPALKAVLQKEASNDWDYRLQPESQYRSSPTPLFLAANLDKPNVVTQLLNWGANPEIRNGLGQAIGDVAKSNAKSYQALQVARNALGEAKWDWKSAKVGPAMSMEDIAAKETEEKLRLRNQQQEMEIEQEKQEHEQKMERLIKMHGSAKLVGGLYAASRGLSEADLRQVERERRARAVEARIAKARGSK